MRGEEVDGPGGGEGEEGAPFCAPPPKMVGC